MIESTVGRSRHGPPNPLGENPVPNRRPMAPAATDSRADTALGTPGVVPDARPADHRPSHGLSAGHRQWPRPGRFLRRGTLYSRTRHARPHIDVVPLLALGRRALDGVCPAADFGHGGVMVLHRLRGVAGPAANDLRPHAGRPGPRSQAARHPGRRTPGNALGDRRHVPGQFPRAHGLAHDRGARSGLPRRRKRRRNSAGNRRLAETLAPVGHWFSALPAKVERGPGRHGHRGRAGRRR